MSFEERERERKFDDAKKKYDWHAEQVRIFKSYNADGHNDREIAREEKYMSEELSEMLKHK